MRRTLGRLVVVAGALAFSASLAHAQPVNPPGPQPTVCTGGQSVTAYPSYGAPLTCGAGGGGAVLDAGSNPQIVQYVGAASIHVGPATVSGDAVIANGGALTVSSIGGKTVTLAGPITTTGTGGITLVFPNSLASYTFPPVTKGLMASDYSNATGPLSIAGGGTGATTAPAALTALGAPGIPVPVGQGGTGSTTAPAALTALGALPLAGGTMTGTLAMGANNITGTGSVSATTFVGALTGHASLDLPLAGGTLTGNLSATSIGVGSAGGALFITDHTTPANNYAITSNNGVMDILPNPIAAGNLLTLHSAFQSVGSGSGVGFEDRGTPGSGFLWYSTGLVARLYNGVTDLLSVDRTSGNTAINGSLFIGGMSNPFPALALFASQFNSLYAPDASGANGSIAVGNVASGGQIVYRNTLHAFQDRAGSAQFANFSTTGTSNVSGAWVVISDASVKQDLVPYTRGLAAITALEPVQFRYAPGTPYASQTAPSRELMGLRADQVKPHVPEIVGSTTATVKGKQVVIDTLEPSNLVYPLINAIKELTLRVETLESRLPAAAPKK